MGEPWNLWQYWSESRKAWISMDENYCMLHDKLVAQGITLVEYVVAYAHGTKFYHYVVDLHAMTQTNQNTGTVRALQRLVPQAPFADTPSTFQH